MKDDYQDITVALAGMTQAIALAKDVAVTGKIDPDSFETAIYSIFQTHPNSIQDIFGHFSKLRLGFEKLTELFNPPYFSSRSTMRYLVSLIQMQKKIMLTPKVHDRLKTRLEKAKHQAGYFSLTHENVVSNLSDIYLDAVSPFNFRILLWGNQRILGVNENMEKIRTLLLAGIRATVLWRQVGGSRWQLLFCRGKIRHTAKQMLERITA